MLVFSLNNSSRVVCWNNCCRKIQKGKKTHLKLFYEISTSCRSLWSSMIWFTKSVSIFRRFKCVRFNFKCLQPPDSKEWKKQVGWYIPRKTVQFSCSVVSDSVTPWTAACQASVSITNSQSLLELMSIESVIPSSHLVLSSAKNRKKKKN